MRTETRAHGTGRVRGLRVAAAFGAGALACVLATLLGAAPLRLTSSPPPVRTWAADRDAHRVYGLDADLVVQRVVDAGWPLAVEARDDGGLWVLRSGGPSSTFGARLTSFDAAGAEENETYLHSANELALHGGRAALVIDHGAAQGRDRLWSFEPDGTGTVLLEDAQLACAVSAGRDVLVAWSTGLVARVAPDGSGKRLAERVHTAAWSALAFEPAPSGADGAIFALDASGARRLCALAPDLALKWSVTLGIDARSLAVVPREERVWVADSAGARVRRYGPGGQLDFERNVPVFAPDRPLALPGGGALFAAPGAIVRLDAQGRVRAGQGGFTWLSDLARAR